MLVATDPTGVITGLGFSTASTTDQQVAETFFAVGHRPNSRLPSVGSAAAGPYVTDKGFEGAENHRRWLDRYGARIIHPPKRNSRKPWPKRLRRWVASIRQIVESVLRQTLQHFWPLGGAASRVGGLASSSGGEGCSSQLLHLAQRSTRSSPAGLRRLVGMVTS